MSDSQSEYGEKSPRPFFAASIGSSAMASFGVFCLFGQNRSSSPHGVVQRSEPADHFTLLSSCGHRHANPNTPDFSQFDL